MAKIETEEIVAPMKNLSTYDAKKEEGRKAYKEFMKFLTKTEIKNIEKSVREFHSKFRT